MKELGSEKMFENPKIFQFNGKKSDSQDLFSENTDENALRAHLN